MAHDMDEEVREVLDKIDALSETDDPATEARKLTDLLKQWPSTYKQVSERRQKAVKRLAETGMTHRQIADLLNISYGRVGQIIAAEAVRRRKEADESSAE
jgi:DNA-binding NarL/FixJ family response regulator